jgi:hypothetical protein
MAPPAAPEFILLAVGQDAVDDPLKQMVEGSEDCVAPSLFDDQNVRCGICREHFTEYVNRAKDEWMLENSIHVLQYHEYLKNNNNNSTDKNNKGSINRVVVDKQFRSFWTNMD